MIDRRLDSDRGSRVAVLVVIAVVAVLTALAIIAAVVASADRDDDLPSGAEDTDLPESSCSVPELPGEVVTVTLSDIGLDAEGQHDRMTTGILMLLLADRSTVSEGTVSFLARNDGRLDHELLIVPLSDAAEAGARTVEADRTASEAGLIGEASTPCGDGAGDGIPPGSASWVTVDLPVGRYELFSNLPGQYTAGMFMELSVVATPVD